MATRTFRPQILVISIRLLLLLLFVYAATSKLLEFEKFKIQLSQSPILTAYADWIAWGVPFLEYTISGLFLFSKSIILAFYSSYALMIMFTMYIILILNSGDFIPCSCGGILENLGWKQHIVFNLVFVVLAIVAIYMLSRETESYKELGI